MIEDINIMIEECENRQLLKYETDIFKEHKFEVKFNDADQDISVID